MGLSFHLYIGSGNWTWVVGLVWQVSLPTELFHQLLMNILKNKHHHHLIPPIETLGHISAKDMEGRCLHGCVHLSMHV